MRNFHIKVPEFDILIKVFTSNSNDHLKNNETLSLILLYIFAGFENIVDPRLLAAELNEIFAGVIFQIDTAKFKPVHD